MADKEKKLRRELLRNKYADKGFDALTEEEKLELLLSYSCTGDTAQLAKELLSDYGSINALANADTELLMKDKKVSEQAAVLIKLIPCLSRTLYLERFKITTLNSSDSAKSFFTSHFIGAVGEQLIITAVNKRFRVVNTKVLAFGSPSQTYASYRDIADFAVKSSCTVFFMAHNHPQGVSLPSDSDILFTKNVSNTLLRLGSILADHIIIGADSAFSFRESGLIPDFSSSPLTGYSCK